MDVTSVACALPSGDSPPTCLLLLGRPGCWQAWGGEGKLQAQHLGWPWLLAWLLALGCNGSPDPAQLIHPSCPQAYLREDRAQGPQGCPAP